MWLASTISTNNWLQIHSYKTLKGPRTLQRFTQSFFWKYCCKNHCPYIKLLKKSLQLWKKFAVCTDDNYFFCSFSCSKRTTSETTKKLLSSIHTTSFFHSCKDFFNSFIYGQQFLQRYFQKNLCENLCSVRGPLASFQI